jgi:hypothetical protein
MATGDRKSAHPFSLRACEFPAQPRIGCCVSAQLTEISLIDSTQRRRINPRITPPTARNERGQSSACVAKNISLSTLYGAITGFGIARSNPATPTRLSSTYSFYVFRAQRFGARQPALPSKPGRASGTALGATSRRARSPAGLREPELHAILHEGPRRGVAPFRCGRSSASVQGEAAGESRSWIATADDPPFTSQARASLPALPSHVVMIPHVANRCTEQACGFAARQPAMTPGAH